MKIDSHQHFWRYDSVEYGWIDESMAVLKKDYLPQDLSDILSENGFDGSVAVQARQTLEETRWLLSLADQFDIIKGVVGWVDLRSDKLIGQLDEFSNHPKFVGVRHVVQDEPDLLFMLRDAFQMGIGQLKDYNLTYDILIFPKQLEPAIELVKQFPEQKFVIDHIAKPFIKNGLIAPWQYNMKRIAEKETVFCKVSGMVTEADWQHWKKEEFLPYLDTVMEAFGPDRVMIGSDWPVCTVAGTYSEVMGIVMDYIKSLSADEQKGVLGGNAVRFYDLEK